MGIHNVMRQQELQEGRAPFGGGAREEVANTYNGRMSRGALAQTSGARQRAEPMSAGMGIEQQMLLMSYAMAGLMVVNIVLLIMVLGRL